VKRIVVVLVIACGGSDKPPRDPHAAGDCDGSWTANGYTACELGCADASAALGAMGPTCQGTLATGDAFTCVKTFEFDGQTGCCASDKPRVLWADCP
jgi:hypothetical protein